MAPRSRAMARRRSMHSRTSTSGVCADRSLMRGLPPFRLLPERGSGEFAACRKGGQHTASEGTFAQAKNPWEDEFMTGVITRRNVLALSAGLSASALAGTAALAQQRFFRIGT